MNIYAYMTILLTLMDKSLILGKKDYAGSTVLRVNVRNANELNTFKELSKTFGYQVDEWGVTDIFVPNERLLRVVKARLEQHGLSYKTLVADVGRLIQDVEESDKRYDEAQRRKRSIGGSRGYEGYASTPKQIIPGDVVGRYATFKEISDWLHEVNRAAKPMTQIFTLGETHEKNPMYLLKIGKPSNVTKPALWMDFGVHAREWISVSTATYVIYHILSEYFRGNNETVELLNKVDFYIMPVANPDGYIYSHEEDRMWRKNRGPDYSNTGCNGTDLNRNFGFHWGEARASCYQCDNQYRGPFPKSEIESRVISAAVQALKKTLLVYMTVHSYSQMWLTRWGYSRDKADDLDEQIALATRAVRTVHDTTGMEYTVGSSANTLYRFSGGAADWAKGSAGIKYSFGIELRDTGEYGFVLPVNQINGTGAEFLAALKTVAKHVMEESKNNTAFNKPARMQNWIDLENTVQKSLLEKSSERHLGHDNEISKTKTSDSTSSNQKTASAASSLLDKRRQTIIQCAIAAVILTMHSAIN